MERIGHLLPTGPRDFLAHRGARRASRRFPLHASVEVVDPALHAHGFTLNASEGGLRVALDRGFPDGTELTLEVRFPAGRESREQVRVVWSRAQPDGWIVGLAFVEEAA